MLFRRRRGRGQFPRRVLGAMRADGRGTGGLWRCGGDVGVYRWGALLGEGGRGGLDEPGLWVTLVNGIGREDVGFDPAVDRALLRYNNQLNCR